MLKLVISQPPDNGTVHAQQPFRVSGQATDPVLPGGERRSIDSVTIQLDGGPAVEAVLTLIPDPQQTIVNFEALVTVTGGQDLHVVTVRATDDQNASVTHSVNVFTGPIFEVRPPSVLVELVSFLPIPDSGPQLDTLISRIQHSLAPAAAQLALIGKIIAGPNLKAGVNSAGLPVLRLGLWIEDAGFPVVPPAPPDFPLPRLLAEAATRGFDQAPPLPGLLPAGAAPGFAISIPVATLQALLDAIAPQVKQGVDGTLVTLDSIAASTAAPASVITTLHGHLPAGISVTATLTEILGTKPLSDADPPQTVPAVTDHDSSVDVGGVLDWLVGILLPKFGAALLALTGIASVVAAGISRQVNGLVEAVIASLPARLPMRNTDLPVPEVPDFPTLVPNWHSFGATNVEILGTGTISVQARDQSQVAMTLEGASFIKGSQSEMAGGAPQRYGLTLANLAPDPDKFSWTVTGAGNDSGRIEASAFDEGAVVDVVFPLPLHLQPGDRHFTLTVNATEMCGTDPNKTLSASTSRVVRVQVTKDPIILP